MSEKVPSPTREIKEKRTVSPEIPKSLNQFSMDTFIEPSLHPLLSGLQCSPLGRRRIAKDVCLGFRIGPGIESEHLVR